MPEVEAEPRLFADASKPRLKADKDNGIIEINAATGLTGVPKEAWEYTLGKVTAVSVETVNVVRQMESAE